jgi:recombination protein RecA
MAKEKKVEAVLSVVDEINKKFGDGSIVKLGEKKLIEVEAFSSGILGLDAALGIKGFPRGRITEIIGNSGTGKTSICLSSIADAQRRGYNCAIVDAEHAIDADHARLLGVDVDNLFISQPDSGNDCLSITQKLIESDRFPLIVLDSIAALTPVQETEQEDFGSANVGLHARLMSQAMRKLNPLVSKHNVCLIMTNQLRANIGAMGYAEQMVPTGGNAVKFFSSVRVELKRLNQIKEGDDIVGHIMKAKVLKNKCYKPFTEYQYDVKYGTNNLQLDEIVALGVEYGEINKGGAWFNLGEEKFQGAAKLKTYLQENQEVFQELKEKVLNKLHEQK